MITSTQLTAAGRHVITFVAGMGSLAASLHFMSAEQAQALVKGVSDISSGIVTMFGAITPLIAVLSGYLASRAASPKQQAASLAANPDVKKIVASVDLANSVPSDKVVAS